MGTPDNYLDSPVKSIIFDEKGKYIFFSFFKIVRSAGGGPAANAGVLPPLRKVHTKNTMSFAPLPRSVGLVSEALPDSSVY